MSENTTQADVINDHEARLEAIEAALWHGERELSDEFAAGDSMTDIGIIETGSSGQQRMGRTATKQAIEFVSSHGDSEAGAAVSDVLSVMGAVGFDRDSTEDVLEQLRRTGEVYEPADGCLRVT